MLPIIVVLLAERHPVVVNYYYYCGVFLFAMARPYINTLSRTSVAPHGRGTLAAHSAALSPNPLFGDGSMAGRRSQQILVVCPP